MFPLQRAYTLLISMLAVVYMQPIERGRQIVRNHEPPAPRFAGSAMSEEDQLEVAERMNKWKPEDNSNVWELSGLYQGDIMTIDSPEKNGILNERMRWPNAIIPYHIEKQWFNSEQISSIKRALESYENLTCVRIRPFKRGDRDFVTVRGEPTGCWSYVGRHGEGQVVNLQSPGCLGNGTIVHEFMHALGFYHQQSAHDRDDFVRIVWDNITPGRQHNFDKYDNRTVSDWGVGYDYSSVMHYGPTAFSRNGKSTIVPKKQNVTLGQRNGLSEKDIKKINNMYKLQCETREQKEKDKETTGSSENNSPGNIIASLWPFSLFHGFIKL